MWHIYKQCKAILLPTYDRKMTIWNSCSQRAKFRRRLLCVRCGYTSIFVFTTTYLQPVRALYVMLLHGTLHHYWVLHRTASNHNAVRTFFQLLDRMNSSWVDLQELDLLSCRRRREEECRTGNSSNQQRAHRQLLTGRLLPLLHAFHRPVWWVPSPLFGDAFSYINGWDLGRISLFCLSSQAIKEK